MKPAARGGRSVTVRNHQRRYRVGLTRLRQTATRAADLAGLNQAELGIVLVSDRKIAALNRSFHQTAGPTDILTFDYGDEAELVISVDHAQANARRYRTTVYRELVLYLVHGLLHLAGYGDATAAEIGRAHV